MVGHTTIFAGKAAPGYYIAKLVIRLIVNVAKIIVSCILLDTKLISEQ